LIFVVVVVIIIRIIIIVNSDSNNNRRVKTTTKEVLTKTSESGNYMPIRYPLLVDMHAKWQEMAQKKSLLGDPEKKKHF
jgi:hypothetical protein